MTQQNGGGLAQGASGRVETDERGVRFFVTPDGQRIPLGGGGGMVTLPVGAGGDARAGSRVAMADGSSVLVGVPPSEAAAHVGGLAPAPGPQTAASSRARQAPRAHPEPAPPTRLPEAPARPAGGDEPEPGEEAAIEMRSEEIQEIISTVPSWVVRCGTTVFFLAILALLGISWMVRYPDLVEGRLTLTTPTPPVRIVARTAGELQQVLVDDHARVPRGAALAVLKNPASYRDVLRLSRRMDALGAALAGGGALPADRFDPSLALGDLQPSYAELMRRLTDYAAFGAGSYYREKMEGVERQLADRRQMHDRLQAQQRTLHQQKQLVERNRERSRLMARQNLIAQTELEKSEAEYLQADYAVRSGESAITSNGLEMTAGSQALLDLRQKLADEERQQRTELRMAFDALRGAITKWEQEYVLRAPVAGRVSFFEVARPDQFVQAAQPVMAVVPEGQALVGTQLIPESRAGKLRTGQRVIVKLDSYPAAEFGTVEGRVEQISLVANAESADKEAMYLVRVGFPRGLVTTYGRRLAFRQEMRGQGSVITDDLRLIQRIFNQLLYAATHATR